MQTPITEVATLENITAADFLDDFLDLNLFDSFSALLLEFSRFLLGGLSTSEGDFRKVSSIKGSHNFSSFPCSSS